MAHVLIVDDSHELLDLFSLILKMKNYSVATASSKNIMLNRLSLFVPDIILLDVRLGGEDGRQLCSDIKHNHRTKHIPIILVSASPALLLDYNECNAADVIEKPFDITIVIEKIEKALKINAA